MEEKNKLIFEVVSAVDDVVVELTEKKFKEHIIVEHPEMIGHEKDIEETIKTPTMVYPAKSFPEKRIHFVRKTHKNEISNYNNVIVEYNDDSKERAHVTTSFYSENLGKGGGQYVYFKFKNNI